MGQTLTYEQTSYSVCIYYELTTVIEIKDKLNDLCCNT